MCARQAGARKRSPVLPSLLWQGHGFSGQVGNQVDVIDDGEWNGLYARGRRVDPFVAFELLLDPVFDFSTGVEAAIFGPHAGHRLADGA